MGKPKNLLVKTGTTQDFMKNVKKIMQLADKKKPVEPSYSLWFEDPTEMLHFLTENKLKLINIIRHHPGSISNIAKFAKRNRTAVSRDVAEMEKYGLIKTSLAVNPGHGYHKIIKLAAVKFKLEACI